MASLTLGGTPVTQQMGPPTTVLQRAIAFEAPDPPTIPIESGRLRLVIAVIVAIVATIVVLLVTGVLQDFYEWLWMNATTIGGNTAQSYTDIMKDHPWILPIIGGVLVFVPAYYLPRRYWARVLVIAVTAGVSYVAGHVFW